MRLKLTLAYDGSGFRGWADQPDVRTVQGVLGRSLERFLRHPPAKLPPKPLTARISVERPFRAYAGQHPLRRDINDIDGGE